MAETVDEAARRVAMMTNVVPMAPVNPGAFSGVPQGGAISNQEAAMMAAQRGMQNTAPMPNVPMPQADMPTPVIDPTNQNSMMAYLQQKAKELRERTGGNPQNMGSLEALFKAMGADRDPILNVQGPPPPPAKPEDLTRSQRMAALMNVSRSGASSDEVMAAANALGLGAMPNQEMK